MTARGLLSSALRGAPRFGRAPAPRFALRFALLAALRRTPRVALAFALLGVPRVAFAAAPGAPSEVVSSNADVFVVGDENAFERVRNVVAPQALGSLRLRWARLDSFDAAALLQRPNRAEADVAVRCWIDLRDAVRVRVFFADREGERFLIRDLTLSGELDELDRESISQTLELSMRALSEEKAVGLTRAEAETLLTQDSRDAAPGKPGEAHVSDSVSTKPPPPKTAGKVRDGLLADAFWAAEAYSDEIAVMHGPGVRVGYAREGERRGQALWLSAQYELGQRYEGRYVGVELDAVALRLGGDVWFRGQRGPLSAGARLLAGLDFVRFSPENGSMDASDLTLQQSRRTRAYVVGAGLLAGLDLGSRARLTLGLLANFDLSPLHFDVEVDGVTSRVVDAFRVRPSLLLALGIR